MFSRPSKSKFFPSLQNPNVAIADLKLQLKEEQELRRNCEMKLSAMVSDLITGFALVVLYTALSEHLLCVVCALAQTRSGPKDSGKWPYIAACLVPDSIIDESSRRLPKCLKFVHLTGFWLVGKNLNHDNITHPVPNLHRPPSSQHFCDSIISFEFIENI